MLVGNGRRVLFWKDTWVGERPLMEALISDYYSEVNDTPHWLISFRRALQDFEESIHQALIGILSDTRL